MSARNMIEAEAEEIIKDLNVLRPYKFRVIGNKI